MEVPVNRIDDDPIDLLRKVSADLIAARIDSLDGEICSLRILLRAARARERRSIQSKASIRPRIVEEESHGR